MRLYFDLRDHQYTLPDVYGVEVAELGDAGRVALDMVRKLRQKNPSAAQDWSAWTLNAVDPTGSVVFSIALGSVV